jgi:single-strand DNA-binding protein
MTTAIQEQPRQRGPIVTKSGNLCADPELAIDKNGKPYVRMRLAVESPTDGNDWRGRHRTDFYDVLAFAPYVDHVAESLAKGDRVVVTGPGEIKHWKGDDGVERTEKVILCDDIGPSLRWATAKPVKAKPTKRDPDPTEHTTEEPF